MMALHEPGVEHGDNSRDRLLPEQMCSSCLKPLRFPPVYLRETERWYEHFGVDPCKCAIFLCGECEPRMLVIEMKLQ